jgi:DNA polymerase alpha subunit A
VIETAPGQYSLETKGLDLVRRDWCALSTKTSSFVLEQLLMTDLVPASGNRRAPVDSSVHHLSAIYEHLETLGQLNDDHSEEQDPRNNPVNSVADLSSISVDSSRAKKYASLASTYPLSLFIIHKSLTKRPEDYQDAARQPHVQVALRMQQRTGIVQPQGSMIPYVIRRGQGTLAERALHPDELADWTASSLKISDSSSATLSSVATPIKAPDASKVFLGPGGYLALLDMPWYMSQQVLPPILRLLQPIPDADPQRLADCLHLKRSFTTGLSFTNLDPSNASMSTDTQLLSLTPLDAPLFASLPKLYLPCPATPSCGSFPFDVLLRPIPNQNSNQIAQYHSIKPSDSIPGWACPTCATIPTLGTLLFTFQNALRQTIANFYSHALVCDDPTCPTQTLPTRRLSVYPARCPNAPFCRGTLQPVLTEKSLYLQLYFYKRLFNQPTPYPSLSEGMTLTADTYAISLLANILNRTLDQSAYPIVSLSTLSSFHRSNNKQDKKTLSF